MNRPLLQIRNIDKVYAYRNKPKKHALTNISFDLYSKEIFGLLGVNGAGKTTISSILASLIPPSDGDILWENQSIYKRILSYREIVGFCPQHQNLDKTLSLEENLLFSGKCYGLKNKECIERKDFLLEKFHLTSYASSLAPTLSGGYRQRFLIARALMHSPKLVILDEPTVGLDPHVRRELWEVIRELKDEGTTVILTTHYLDEAQELSDRVCFLHAGKIQAIDRPSNLMKMQKKKNLEEVFLHFVEKGTFNE